MTDEEFADVVFRNVERLVEVQVAPLRAANERLIAANADLMAKLSALEARAPERGPAGADGKDGAGVDMAEVARMIDVAVQRAAEVLPKAKDGAPGRDGVDGKDGAPGRDGADGQRGEAGNDGAPGRDGVDGANGKDGADAVLPDIDAMLDERLARAVAALPVPANGKDGRDGKDGASIDPAIVAEMVEAAAAKAVEALAMPRDGLDGKDGADGLNGKDGADGIGLAGAIIDRAGQLVVTFTNGQTKDLGLVVGRDGADGRNGDPGAPGRDGFSLEDFDAETKDGGRTLVLSFVQGDLKHTVELGLDTMLYRGVFKDGQAYERGDTCTWAGSLWHCEAPTSEKPGEGSKTWQLAAKRGRDGKDGAAGVKGDPGQKGEPGRDGRAFT